MKERTLSEALEFVRSKRGLEVGEPLEKPEGISTGNLSIDRITGVGGLPRGRIVELFGPPSSGKSTTALQAAVTAQRAGLNVLYADYENALDPTYCEALGLDMAADTWLPIQPETMEQGMNAVRDLVGTGEIGLVITDSVAAMVTQKEMEADLGESRFKEKARLMYELLRQLTPVVRSTKTSVVFVNHIQQKIDMSPMGQRLAASGVKQTTTPGGEAVKFLSSVRLEYRSWGKVKEGEDKEVVGTKVQVTAVKNKVAAPFQTCETRIRFGKGFSQAWSAVHELVDAGVIKKGASGVFKFPEDLVPDGVEVPRGEESLVRALDDNQTWLSLLVERARG